MQFELKDVYSVGAPKKSEDGTTRSIAVNIKVGIVGIPDEPKYSRFFAEFTKTYTWNTGLTDDAIETGMETFAAQFVADEYPDVV